MLLLLLAFISCCSLRPYVLFLPFLLGYLFLLCNPLWFRTLGRFSVGSWCAGEPRMGHRPCAQPCAHLGGLFTWMCSVARDSAPEPRSSALLCISKHVQQKPGTRLGPPTPCPAPLFGLGSPPGPTILTTEWRTWLL